MDAWTLLGLEPTKDKGALRRAWAKIVKQHRPDQDPQKYQQLREAYEAAQRYQEYDEEEDEEGDDESVITYRFTPQTLLTPQDEPLPQAETVTLADWDAQTLNEQAQALATSIVADEMAGCQQLETFLATGLPDALAARRYFSERLADALSREQWLTRGMLEQWAESWVGSLITTAARRCLTCWFGRLKRVSPRRKKSTGWLWSAASIRRTGCRKPAGG
ncbi:J domain-containing protein [Cronobacter sakazakii]|nr:J domain-containing protein [Cronobacter sakazakii]